MLAKLFIYFRVLYCVIMEETLSVIEQLLNLYYSSLCHLNH